MVEFQGGFGAIKGGGGEEEDIAEDKGEEGTVERCLRV